MDRQFRRSLPRQFHDMVDGAIALGATVRYQANGHVQVVPPGGAGKPISFPCSPGAQQSVEQKRSELRRAGLVIERDGARRRPIGERGGDDVIALAIERADGMAMDATIEQITPPQEVSYCADCAADDALAGDARGGMRPLDDFSKHVSGKPMALCKAHMGRRAAAGRRKQTEEYKRTGQYKGRERDRGKGLVDDGSDAADGAGPGVADAGTVAPIDAHVGEKPSTDAATGGDVGGGVGGGDYDALVAMLSSLEGRVGEIEGTVAERERITERRETAWAKALNDAQVAWSRKLDDATREVARLDTLLQNVAASLRPSGADASPDLERARWVVEMYTEAGLEMPDVMVRTLLHRLLSAATSAAGAATSAAGATPEGVPS